jgi:hypothetical protein
MSDLLRYHQILVKTMASYQPAPMPFKANRLDILHECSSTGLFAQVFSRFLELPKEIRLQIWKHCLPGPRAVEVCYGQNSEFLESKYPPPIALHICRESRAEALKHYELAFDSRPNASRIYFDFSRDGLHFKYRDTFSNFPPEETLRAIGHDLVRVKFMSCTLDGSGTSPVPYLPDLREFKALEEITLLISPGGPDGPDRLFVDPSTVTLSPSCNFSAIQFTDRDRTHFQNSSLPRISIMCYISGGYRIC